MMKFKPILQTATLLGALTASWLISTPAVQANTIDRNRINATVTVGGRSGGGQSSPCGFIANQPNHRLEVTDSIVALRFLLEGGGQPTLAIQDSQGRIECVTSHQLSNGTLEFPGAWESGQYNVFVGDRTGGQHQYSLSVSRER